MARTPQDHSVGQSDSSGGHHETTMDATSGATMTLPGNEFVTDATMLRDGQDLILRAPDGDEITVQNYFSADPAPVIVSEGGAALTPDLVDLFVTPLEGVQFAQKGSVDDVSPVGIVKEASGEATVTHPNGVVEKAAVGTPIYEGDIVETKGGGAVNITFIDDTTFAVSENARLAIDEYVFDPATQSGESNFSVLRGVFVFTSGLIGREDPDDVQIDTPVGSIGIRGTTIMGDINPDGESQITVVEGAIVVKNAEGEQTLSQQFETVTLSGFNEPMSNEGVLDASQIANDYNVVRTVSAPLFSTLDDMGPASDDPASEEAPADMAPAETKEESAPVETAPMNDSPADAEPVTSDPVNKTEAAPADDTVITETIVAPEQNITSPDQGSFDAGFDTSAGTKSDAVFTSTSTTTSTTNTVTAATATQPTGTTTATLPPPPPPGSTSTTTTTTTTNSTGGTTTTVLPPLALLFDLHPVDDLQLVPGHVIGTITTTVNYTGVSFAWTALPNDGTNPLFEMEQVEPNRIAIKLTAAGASFMDVGDLISFGIEARLQDGRMISGTGQVVVADLVNSDMNLNDVISGGVAGASFIPSISADSGHGANVAALGDINHDGQADYAFVTEQATQGRLFIDNGAGNQSNNNLGLAPYNLSDTTSLSLAGLGDFNGDGVGDLAIGAPQADAGGTNDGKIIITSGTDASPLLEITGFADGAFAGFSISDAGDFNGDGFNDLIIGAPQPSGNGSTYLIFGSASGTPINVASAFNGFKITGGFGEEFGRDIAGIGDFNMDGYSDFVASNIGLGLVKVYFGNNAGIATTPLVINNIGVDLGDTGIPVVSMGDLNGDGAADMGVVDLLNDTLHIFYGSTSRGPGTVDISTSNLKIVTGSDLIGGGSAGDFNGDGRDDGVIATRTGDMVDVVVFYGRPGVVGTFNPDGAPIQDVFHMTLDLASAQFGLASPATDEIEISVSSAGDLNGDGFDDLLIGLPDLYSDDGGLLIIYGRAEGGDVIMGNMASGSGQSLIGNASPNIMSTNGFANIAFSGGGGNDNIQINAGGSARDIDGGAGLDTLTLMTGANISLQNLGENLTGIEKIVVQAGTQLTIGIDQIFRLLQSSDDGTLTFDTTAAGSSVQVDNNGDSSTSLASPGIGFTNVTADQWAFNGYTVYIEPADVTVANVV